MSINDLGARLRNGDGFRNFQELLDFSYARTPCEEFPEECQPRTINHVVWDADDTLWDIKPFGIASMCHKPFRKLSDEAVEMQCERLVEVSKDPTGKEKIEREGHRLLGRVKQHAQHGSKHTRRHGEG